MNPEDELRNFFTETKLALQDRAFKVQRHTATRSPRVSAVIGYKRDSIERVGVREIVTFWAVRDRTDVLGIYLVTQGVVDGTTGPFGTYGLAPRYLYDAIGADYLTDNMDIRQIEQFNRRLIRGLDNNLDWLTARVRMERVAEVLGKWRKVNT